MLTFFITASVMLAACYTEFMDVLKDGRKRLAVFYTSLLVLSLMLTALHCVGFSINDIRIHLQ